MYVGWKYGSTGSLSNNRTNTNSSTIRTTVINWYNTNIKATYDKYISYDAIYCNDRSTGGGYSSNSNMYYAAYNRLNKNKKPTYQCGMNTTGGYTNTSGTWISGGTEGTLYNDANASDKFKEGVGLMTADEVAMAGGVFGKKAPNTYYYRNSKSICSGGVKDDCSAVGYDWWITGTPARFDTDAGKFGGEKISYLFTLEGSRNYSQFGYSNSGRIRPVISLKSDTLVSGTGTASDPYVVEGI